MPISRPLRIAALASAAVAAGAGVWLLRTYDPNAAGNPFPPCMFRAFTGCYCIGCGLTRALHALVHGDLPGALSMNPLAVLLMPLMPLMVAWSGGWQPRALAPLMRWLMEPKLWLVLLPGYWIARNLPWHPFTLLAPG
ncbi:hypothetical protein B1992_04230 [Pseudoxanthomonas broegbernensis]|uniref:DUF2752 domain-containing protein n=1 Tax=Pseudoxanthomonas broegbernensis TaxID=83619 RepID=A0A7V8GNR9_9GAMM|nr:DUF2752 domain-containing protein [Pseudoxanthomonas broegbernensis]KAF1687199.1 hypothetical protein B1992_04230 [Pseudoxanthomonas broegbernensis]MBB6065816.1 hypothetical protein [Pseudoxanthomonas broegbernensis]